MLDSTVRQALRVSFISSAIAGLCFFIDTVLLNDRSYAIVTCECLSHLGFITWYLWVRRKMPVSIQTSLIALYSSFFLISDISFTLRYYLRVYDIEWVDVTTIALPCAFAFLATTLVLTSILKPFFVGLLSRKKIFSLAIQVVIILIFILMAHFLFISNFGQKYGAMGANFYTFSRLAAVEMGALTAAFGVICLCLGNNVFVSLLGLGLFLQVLGDWGMRLKVYLSMSALFGIGEYLFFAGLFLALSAGYFLRDYKAQDKIMLQSTISAEERIAFIIPLLLLCLVSASTHNNNAQVIELFFLTGCVLSVSIFCSTIISSRHLEKLRTYIVSDEKRKREFNLPQELEDVRTAFDAKAVEFAKLSAVAQTIQYLAHDVRKPFAMMKIAIDSLAKSHDVSVMRRMIAVLQPSVGNAIVSVDRMLDDILEVSRISPLMTEPCSLQNVIASVLAENAPLHPNANFRFTYDFNHDSDLEVDETRIKRAIANIVTNAFQAVSINVGVSHHMWFRSERVSNASSIRITIGNTGSSIPSGQHDDIFDNFFTSRKRGGTGLGLAIAKKIMEQHGGSISCVSQENSEQVEFHLTLPVKGIRTIAFDNGRLLPYSRHYLMEAQHADKDNILVEDPAMEKSLRFSLAQKVAKINRKINLAVADDDSIYCSAIVQMIEQDSQLSELVNISQHLSLEELEGKLGTLDYLVCDIDFGKGEISGFEFLQKQEARSVRHCMICIHSNRNLSVDLERIVAIGADFILPKPMSRLHLLKFLTIG